MFSCSFQTTLSQKCLLPFSRCGRLQRTKRTLLMDLCALVAGKCWSNTTTAWHHQTMAEFLKLFLLRWISCIIMYCCLIGRNTYYLSPMCDRDLVKFLCPDLLIKPCEALVQRLETCLTVWMPTMASSIGALGLEHEGTLYYIVWLCSYEELWEMLQGFVYFLGNHRPAKYINISTKWTKVVITSRGNLNILWLFEISLFIPF